MADKETGTRNNGGGGIIWAIYVLLILWLIVGGAMFFIAPWLGVLLILALLIWIALSIKILGPNEMAMLIFLGMQEKKLDSGPHIVPWPIFSLERIPKNLFRIDLPKNDVQTGDLEKYGIQTMKVDAEVYISFGKTREDISRVIEKKIPRDVAGLSDIFSPSLIAVIRAAFGGIVKLEDCMNIDIVNDKIKEKIPQADQVLEKAGLVIEKMIVEEIFLSDQIKKIQKETAEAGVADKESDERVEVAVGPFRKLFLSMGYDERALKEEFKKPDFRKKVLEAISREQSSRGGAKQIYIDPEGGGGGSILSSLLAAIEVFKGVGGNSGNSKSGNDGDKGEQQEAQKGEPMWKLVSGEFVGEERLKRNGLWEIFSKKSPDVYGKQKES